MFLARFDAINVIDPILIFGASVVSKPFLLFHYIALRPLRNRIIQKLRLHFLAFLKLLRDLRLSQPQAKPKP